MPPAVCSQVRNSQTIEKMNNRKIKVGITHGDTNGIGYEVILKMLEDPRIADLCTVVVYGSGKVASFYRKAMELPQVQFNRIDTAAEAKDGAYNIINVVGEDLKVDPGTASEEAGAAALAALEAAVADLRAGDIDVVVTAPINKHSIQSSSFNFPGHTEYLETSFNTDDAPCKALMIMCADKLRVALLTTHTPLAKVAEAVTKEAIVDKLKEFDRSLRRDFGVQSPRIAVLSLNPHAGEDGLLGSEEKDIIIPAIKGPATSVYSLLALCFRRLLRKRQLHGFRRCACHVSRPGPHPVQDACHGFRGEFYCRASRSAHFARPWHRL